MHCRTCFCSSLARMPVRLLICRENDTDVEQPRGASVSAGQFIKVCRMHTALGFWLRLSFVAAIWQTTRADLAMASPPLAQAAPYANYPLPDDLSIASHTASGSDILTIEGNISSRPGSPVFHINTNVQVLSLTVLSEQV